MLFFSLKNCIPNITKSIKFSCFLIDLMMFGMQFLINFEAFIYLIFLKGTTYKKRLFWIHFESMKIETFCWQYLRRKCTKYSFENWSKTAYQTSKNRSNFYVFWSIWWCLVCSFWPILKWVFCTFFSRVLPTKLFNFHWLKMDPKKTFFVRHTLGKNKINKSFKIDQKLHTKHHQIDQKTWKFDQFFDVWYVYFDQF